MSDSQVVSTPASAEAGAEAGRGPRAENENENENETETEHEHGHEHGRTEAKAGHGREPKPAAENPTRRRRNRRPAITVGKADRVVEGLLGLVVGGSVLAVGTVHVLTLFVVAGLALGLGVLAMMVHYNRHKTWPWSAPAVVVLALTGWTLLQAIPLPMGLLSIIAPSNASVWAHALSPLGEAGPSWAPISLDPGATWVEVLKGLTYLCVVIAATVVAARRGGVYGIALVFVSALAAGVFTLVHGIAGMKAVFGIYEPVHAFGEWHTGPLLNANHLAGYLNLGTMCGLGILLMQKPPIKRWFSGLGVATLVGLSVSTASRGGVVLLPVGVALVVVLMRRRSVARSGVVSKGALDILTLAAIGGGLILAVLGLTTQQLNELMQEDLSKLSIMDWAKSLVWDHAWVGIGRGAFETTYPAYRPNPGHLLWTHPENIVVQWASEWGIVVALLAFGAIGWMMMPRRAGASRSALTAGAWAGIIVVVLQNLVDFSMEMASVGIALAALFGSFWGDAERRGFKAVPLAKSELSVWRGGWKSWWPPVALAGVGVLVGLLAVLRGWPPAEQARRELAELMALPPQRAVVFRPLLRDLMLRHPADPYFPLIGGYRAWVVGDENPVPYLQRAIERGKTYGRAHLLMARLLKAKGATNQALLELRFAAEQDPSTTAAGVALALEMTKDYDTLMRMVPLGPEGARVADVLGAWLTGSLPELGRRFDQEALRRNSTLTGPRSRRARRLIADLKLGEKGVDCRGEEGVKNCLAEIGKIADDLTESNPLRPGAPLRSNGARMRAEALEATGNTLAAARVLRDVCDFVEDRLECVRMRVALEHKLKNTPVVDELLQQIAALGCLNASACTSTYMWIGGFENGRKNTGSAINAFARATNYDPTNAGAWMALADASARLGMHARAAEAYARAAKLRPKDEGLEKKALEQREKALRTFQK